MSVHEYSRTRLVVRMGELSDGRRQGETVFQAAFPERFVGDDTVVASNSSTLPSLEEVAVDDTVGQGRWMVVMFNNDTNSMDEVVEILMRATGCDSQEATIEMWEAHTFGKAPVHFATKSECKEVASVISAIGIKTEVCPEWED